MSAAKGLTLSASLFQLFLGTLHGLFQAFLVLLSLGKVVFGLLCCLLQALLVFLRLVQRFAGVLGQPAERSQSRS